MGSAPTPLPPSRRAALEETRLAVKRFASDGPPERAFEKSWTTAVLHCWTMRFRKNLANGGGKPA
jgi:hypothetical protein